jgi:P-type E1-E2 ATPase
VADHVVQIGSPALLADIARSAYTSKTYELVTDAEASGATVAVALVDDIPAGVLVLIDRVRPEARGTVAALTTLTGRSPVLLTGDNAGAAHRIGIEVGIRDIRAELLPEDKVTAVGELHAAGRRVLAVGDGLNDSGMLAAADTGIAMGRHGSDLALETADAVLVRDDLTALPKVIELSRRARRVVVANLVIAATVITALVIWDLAGRLPLPLGVAGHESSTVIVGLNGLRLLHESAWRRAGTTGPSA